MGTLFIVATPIGNLEDITYRAVRILDEVSLIAAEDTRTTGKLLDHYQISTRLTSYHEHNKEEKIAALIEHLREGNLALVSDAGTPGINDPGYNLIRAALEVDHAVVPIPGPSSLIAALSASGLPTDSFHFLGYIPRKSSHRKKVFQKVKDEPYTLIFLESPHRILDSLPEMEVVFGDRDIAVARELTKLHEEIFRGRLTEAVEHFREQEPRGEFTLVVKGASPLDQKWSREKLLDELQKLHREDRLPPSKIAKDVAERSKWARRKVYKLLQDLA
ncbi:MAG: 16S rRNA (cytidine(1402)-2'-O)-methyltransferase [Anaerolineales bacterium]|nr:16S rRNA (cytidine(1402)-2'-O)-methyltransferase [Anaerolineales bacterium]MBS3752220.1 16S rRNA (cytidine(1402)-2'-O)-methyltransferase [Anaerolineales bacterium]